MAYPSARPWPAASSHPRVPARAHLVGAAAVLALPFLLPGRLSEPMAIVAFGGGAALAVAALEHPRDSRARTHLLTGALAFAAAVLVAGQTVLEGGGRTRPLMQPTAPAALAEWTDAPARPRTERRRAARATLATAATAPTTAPSRREGPPRPVAAPSRREGPPRPAGAARFVRDYYAALNGRRFAAAWRMLTPAVRSAFGGFAAWRAGYARTVASMPGSVRVSPTGAGATVGLTLRAGDRGACGRTVVRRFAVTWRLARMDAGWRATAAAARLLSGAAPTAAC